MARKYEDRTREVTSKVCVEVTCDLCGAKASEPGDFSGSCYELDETEVSVTVKHRKGDQYPDCAMWEDTEVDMCPTCFQGKLVPWLKEQGADVRVKDGGW